MACCLLLLLGIVKKNSIILVDYANQNRARGLDAAAAMEAAGPVRLRPILMTSVATLMAALPPALGLGPGSEIRTPMAIAVIGGLVVSTALSLLVVPSFYVAADGVVSRLRGRLHLRRRAAAPAPDVPSRCIALFVAAAVSFAAASATATAGVPGTVVADFKARTEKAAAAETNLAQELQRSGLAAVLQGHEKALQENAANEEDYIVLQRLCAGQYGLARDEKLRLRALLRAAAKDSCAVLALPGEPGQPLVVCGTVRDARGDAVAGALVEVFHADAKGEYTAERAMDEPLARLFGFMRTGRRGGYCFQTIRPGGYAGAPIPQHVHLRVSAPGYREHGCRSTCQLVFADDPRLTATWQEWAREGGNPILTVEHGSDGVERCTYDVVLEGE